MHNYVVFSAARTGSSYITGAITEQIACLEPNVFYGGELLRWDEYCQLSPDVAARICQARARGGRIIAVGTTSVRVLETAARNLEPVTWNLKPRTWNLKPFSGWTNLFIYPGHQFRAVKCHGYYSQRGGHVASRNHARLDHP